MGGGTRAKPQYIQNLPNFEDIAGTHEWIAGMHRRMLESLLELDNQVGAIIAALGSQLADTYIIFTADHGLLLGQHRIPYAKVAPYDPSIRVPLVIRGPGVVEEFTRPELVCNLDLTATILQLAGATPLRTGDGKSLVPLLSAQKPVDDFRTHLLVEFMEDHLRPWTAPGGPAGPSYVIPKYACVRSHGWKYVRYDNAAQEVELYDIRSDPHELTNRQNDDDYAAVEAHLAAILRRVADCAGTECQVTANEVSAVGGATISK
jgi:arylsulfatase A-like enzyme